MNDDFTMNDIKVKYDSDSHDIDANTLIGSLLHLSTLIQEVNRELNTGRKVNVKIQATEKGSFIVHLVIETTVLENLKNLLSNETVQYAAGIVTVVGGLFGLAKLLKGEKAEIVENNGNKVTIKNNKGAVTIVNVNTLDLYNTNTVVRNSISQNFKVLEADDSIKGFSLKDQEDKDLVNIPAEDFPVLAESASMENNISDRSIKREVMLNINKIVFDDNQKWDFYYDGNKISAKIEDVKFREMIDKGERFAKGDSLRAEIEIYQVFDSSVNSYINKSYKVVTILEHIPRPDQGKLFGNIL